MIDTTKKILISVPSGIINDYIVPEGIEIILDNAFEGCTFINKIILPQSLKALGNNCFKDCYALNELHIPTGVEYIAPRCFHVYFYGLYCTPVPYCKINYFYVLTQIISILETSGNYAHHEITPN